MTEFPETDLETLRRSRVARLEADLHELASRLTHLHWPSTEAEVTDCRAAKNRYWGSGRYSNERVRLGYIVGFAYSVEGKAYAGTLNSPVEVLQGDRFALRYNPDHPNENNSICSDNSPSSIFSKWISLVLGILIFLLAILAVKDTALKFFRH